MTKTTTPPAPERTAPSDDAVALALEVKKISAAFFSGSNKDAKQAGMALLDIEMAANRLLTSGPRKSATISGIDAKKER